MKAVDPLHFTSLSQNISSLAHDDLDTCESQKLLNRNDLEYRLIEYSRSLPDSQGRRIWRNITMKYFVHDQLHERRQVKIEYESQDSACNS